MATIRFYLNPKGGKFYINAQISHQSEARVKSLGYSVPNTKVWDDNKQRAKSFGDMGLEINAKIAAWEHRFEDYAGKVRRREIEFDFAECLSIVSGDRPTEKTVKINLSTVAWDFYRLKAETTDFGTSKQYMTVCREIDEYAKEIGSEIPLRMVDKSFYQQFGQWLINKGNINNTVNRKISRIVSVMDYAFEKRLIPDQYYKVKFKFKGHESDAHPPLLPSEIELLRGYTPKTRKQINSLQAFLFACETGLRISDVKQLHSRHIKTHSDSEGEFKYIDFTQEKTANSNFVPLNKTALEILSTRPKGGKVFDLPSEHYLNRLLKDIAEDVGLNRQVERVSAKGNKTIKEFRKIHQEISFHCGRSSYITNSLASGLNPVFVMDNAGHSDLKITMSYSTQEKINRMRETLKLLDK